MYTVCSQFSAKLLCILALKCQHSWTNLHEDVQTGEWLQGCNEWFIPKATSFPKMEWRSPHRDQGSIFGLFPWHHHPHRPLSLQAVSKWHMIAQYRTSCCTLLYAIPILHLYSVDYWFHITPQKLWLSFNKHLQFCEIFVEKLIYTVNRIV